MRAVDHVVRGHDRAGLAFLDGDLERGQVQLAHRALVHDRVQHHAALFLVVEREVLDATRNAVGLYAAYVSRGHLAREQRIFGKILEVPAAARVALEVGAGSEQDVDFLVHRLFAQHLAHLLAQLVVPAVRHGGGSRETGGGYGRVKSEVIRRRSLLADAVRAVRQEYGRDLYVVAIHPVGLPEILTGRKRDFLLDSQLVDQFFVLHQFFPSLFYFNALRRYVPTVRARRDR